MALKQTPSQTIGPFFSFGLASEQYNHPLSQIAGANLLADSPDVDGQRIRLTGRVLDGAGAPMADALVEIWQADGQGRYAHPADTRGSNTTFKVFGRCGTGTDGEQRFVFDTVKPAAVAPGEAPHINVCLFARGLLNHVFTRIYFSDEANDSDPVLEQVPAERRATLIAQRLDGAEDGGGPAVYQFDIHMQGDQETVFFDP